MRNNKYFILGVEVFVTLVLLLFLTIKIVNPWFIEFDLQDFYSNYGHLEETGWRVDDGREIPADEDILEGPYLHLDAGSYTLELEYKTNEPQKVYIFAYEHLKRVHANIFELNPNKNKAIYHFYTTGEVNGFNLRFLYSGKGDFSLYSGLITENANNSRLLLFAWMIVVTVVNIYCFTDVIQRNKEVILALSAIVLISSLPLFANGIIVGNDGDFHLMRIEGLYQGILDGCFPVKMEMTLNDGFGYPVPVFYGSALMYFAAGLRLIGFSVLSAYKGYILIINILTVLVTYTCGKQIFRKQETALWGTAVYTTANYRLLDVYVRNAVGEYSSFAFLPLIALAIWKMYLTEKKEEQSTQSAILLGGGMLGLLYTHILTIEMVCFVLFLIAVCFCRKTIKKTTLLTYAKAVGIVTVGGLGFYVPFIDYYMKVDTIVKNKGADYIQHYGASIADYFCFFKRVSGAASYNAVERMQLTPGAFLMFGLIGGLYLLASKATSKQLKYSVCGSGFMLFVASNAFPWNMFAEMKVIGSAFTAVQFPFRYIGIALVFLWLLFGLVLEEFETMRKIQYNKIQIPFCVTVLILVSVFTSSLFENLDHVDYMDRCEVPRYTYSFYEWPYDESRYAGGYEYLIRGTYIRDLKYTLLTENVMANIKNEKGTDMEIEVDAQTGGWLDIPRFNYPYYHAVDIQGKEYTIQNGMNNMIRIVFDEPYHGEIILRFIQPWLWIISEGISGIFFMSIIIIWIKKKTLKRIGYSQEVLG